MTYIAVPIAAANLEKAVEQVRAATAAGAEVIELRTDYFDDLSVLLVKKLVAETKEIIGKKIKLIATCRDAKQGGAKAWPEALRIDVLTAALMAGADYMDFEYENFFPTLTQSKIKRALSQSLKGRLILSAHNFDGKFDNMLKLHRHMLTLQPSAIPKIVYTANHINDCFDAFDLLHRTSGERIVFCMGQAGLY